MVCTYIKCYNAVWVCMSKLLNNYKLTQLFAAKFPAAASAEYVRLWLIFHVMDFVYKLMQSIYFFGVVENCNLINKFAADWHLRRFTPNTYALLTRWL